MEWQDEAIVLSLRRHGENASILEALTRDHGRHLGLVHGGGVSSKARAMLQPGNRVKLSWRARLSEHLGAYTAELAQARSAAMFESGGALIGLNAFVAVASAVLPEREPHRAAFTAGEAVLDAIAEHEPEDWLPLYVRWEAGLLDELGFGLDLASCAASGTTENLTYVSPKSGRAVSEEAAAPYRDKLLRLPGFLLGTDVVDATDAVAGLDLTAHFLDRRVLAPHDKTLPDARRRLHDLAGRIKTPKNDS
jgi:DNA repair protein RecO (recombination protein O)